MNQHVTVVKEVEIEKAMNLNAMNLDNNSMDMYNKEYRPCRVQPLDTYYSNGDVQHYMFKCCCPLCAVW